LIYVLDTNVVSDFLKRYPPVTMAIMDALARGDRLLVSQPIHYELTRTLIRHNASTQLNRLNNEILPQFEWVELTDADWLQAAQFWADAVSRGKQLADVDLLLAALAQRLDATLVSADDDFTSLPIQRVNWRTHPPS
jgi:predicted nucleic acid-binding protein